MSVGSEHLDVNPRRKLVLAGLLAPLLAVAAFVWMTRWMDEHAAPAATSKPVVRAEAVVEKTETRPGEAAPAAVPVEVAVEAPIVHLESVDTALPVAEAARETNREKAARKQAAWEAFFTPRKACENPPNWDIQVECGNAYMRAKREFDERWERGELR